MNSRHRAREVAFQILYRFDLEVHSSGTPPPTGEALLKELVHHFEHFKVPEELREFAAALVVGTVTTLPEIDPLIETYAAQWRVSRMGMVDRNILRMSVYEMKHFPDIPPQVTIDEAVEVAKQFGSEETPAFINGILDAILRKEITPAKAAQS
jgi:N utilization substance protein B